MKILLKVNLVALTLLSITSGIAKIMLLPRELEFFEGAGFSSTLIVIYGVTQLAGGILLILRKVRSFAAIFLAANFFVSTIIILMDGEIAFGIFSILPIFMAAIVINETMKTHNKHMQPDPAKAGPLM